MPNSLTFQELLDNPSQYLNKTAVGRARTSAVSLDEKTISTKDAAQGKTFLDNIKDDCDLGRNLIEGSAKRTQIQQMGLNGFFWLYWRERVAEKNALSEDKRFFSEYKQAFVNQITQNTPSSYIKNQALFCADLSGSQLQNLNFRDADLRFSDLSKCDLIGSGFQNADLGDANLKDAKLPYGFFAQIKNLEGADLSGAEFEHKYIHIFKEGTDGLYRVIFDKDHLPSDYKDVVKKQELENHIRESYENAKNELGDNCYNSHVLKLIQASGYSPLDWGKNPEDFQKKHNAFVVAYPTPEKLVVKIERQIAAMLDPNNLNGYAQARGVKPFNPFKWWSQKDTREGQIEELRDLFKLDSQGLPKILPLATVAETLLKVSNAIRREDNFFKSELLKQIEQISDPDPKVYPERELPKGYVTRI